MFFKSSVRCLTILLIGVSLIITNIPRAEAAFTLSVTPYDGGFDLRFGKVDQLSPIDVEKEVTITINTDIGKRYQVIQSISTPLTNTEGTVLAQGALTVYTLRGSNARGTLGLDSERAVTSARAFLYTSDVAGNSDSFTVVYRLKHSLISTSGLYRGRLSFSLQPIDSTQAPRTVNLNVEVDIEVPSKIEVTTLTGGKTIELVSPETEGLPAQVSISIQGRRQGRYKILQRVEPLMNLEAEELKDAVTFSLKGGKAGILACAGETALKPGETLLYTSDPRGLDDEIEITYYVKESLKAGRYRGNISYYIESTAYPSPKSGLIDTLQLDVNIKPIFELKIMPESGGVIEFKNVREESVQETKVLIEINSNLAQPYQVTQDISSMLTTKDGKVIPRGYFKFSTKEVDDEKGLRVKGTLKYPSKSTVEPDETIIFISNRKGESDRFKIIYELSAPRDQWGGDYTTGINYSLSQIEIQ